MRTFTGNSSSPYSDIADLLGGKAPFGIAFVTSKPSSAFTGPVADRNKRNRTEDIRAVARQFGIDLNSAGKIVDKIYAEQDAKILAAFSSGVSELIKAMRAQKVPDQSIQDALVKVTQSEFVPF